MTSQTASTPIPPALSGERIEFECAAGRVNYYRIAPPSSVSSAPPMLLIHSMNASGSAAEMRPVYDRYGTLRSVYAIDLPGFGLSERSDRAYLPRLMTDAIHALVARIRAEHNAAQVGALGGDIGGSIIAEAEVAGLILRHRASPSEMRPELSGHFHPKFHGQSHGRRLSRPCFVMSQTRLILPAFGAFTGGLAADHPEIIAAVGPGAEALVPTAKRLLRFAL